MEDAVIHLATAARSTAAISVHDCPREDEHLRMLAHTVPVSNGDISASSSDTNPLSDYLPRRELLP